MKKIGLQRARLCPKDTQPGLEVKELRDPGHRSIQGWVSPTPTNVSTTECMLLTDLTHSCPYQHPRCSRGTVIIDVST